MESRFYSLYGCTNKKIIMIRTKLVFLIVLSILFLGCTKTPKEIQATANQNIETLAICFEVADKGFWNFPFDDYQPMKQVARDRFRQYHHHEAIQLIDTLVSNGFWLDAMTEVMLKSTALPSAKLQYELDESTLKRLPDNGSLLIDNFINALNNFYVDADLEAYFKKHEDYFKNVNREVIKNLPSKDFINTMENYYGKKNESYTLIPSPTLYHTMGFGKRIKASIGYKVFNVFGPLKVTKDSLEFGYGFDDFSEIEELSVHEFGHSFINPATETPQNQAIIDKYEYLFEPIRKDMENQGYRSWSTCVAEHIVRLGEIRIVIAMGDTTRANRIRNDYINNRNFIYLEALEKSILKYEANRDTYKSIDSYIPELLGSFEKN